MADPSTARGRGASDRAADLEALEREPANASMLAYLRDHSAPLTRRNASPWDIDGFELHTHPDLSERLEEVGAGLPGGGRFVGVYGYATLVDSHHVIRAVALGNAGFAFRVADPAVRADIEANSRFHWSSGGGDWVGADAWPVDLPLAVGSDRVRAWLTAAFDDDPPKVTA